MNFKIKSLIEKIYNNFIKGIYGSPKIPSKNDIINKIKEITTAEYIPITNNKKIDKLNIIDIKTKFNTIIDDIEILFNSVEKESREILDQLTTSISQNNEIKRELKHINTTLDDISTGGLVNDNLSYSFTESFNNLLNINSTFSDIVNINAGLFTIQDSNLNIVPLNHYYGKKLDVSINESFSDIVDYGFIGDTDAAAILDPDDPRQLTYKIKTLSPTSIKASLTIQLKPNAEIISINSVILNIDSDISSGFIRLYIKDKYQWVDAPSSSIQTIKSDEIKFNFDPIDTSHIKIEFIKDVPDIPTRNEYYFVINNLVVSMAASQRTAVLYSKPIEIKPYSNELPFISTVQVSSDIHIPKGCRARLFVASDKLLSGAFLDSNGVEVSPNSPSAVRFDPSRDGLVYLSDLLNSYDSLSGVEYYNGIDQDWIQLQLSDTSESYVPNTVVLNSYKEKPKIINSLYQELDSIVFGDTSYTGVFTVYSGWCNSSNPFWTNQLPYVLSGIIINGVNVAALSGVPFNQIEDEYGNLNPIIANSPLYSGQWLGYGKGYPFNCLYNQQNAFISSNQNEPLKYSEYVTSLDGWYRNLCNYVTPSGINVDVRTNNENRLNLDDAKCAPDFYFNNTAFYKIYKFGKNSNILTSSVKLYSYQEKFNNSIGGYYPHSFAWNYKKNWKYSTSIVQGQLPSNSGSFNKLSINIKDLDIDPNYTITNISELKIKNSNSVLDRSEYNIVYDDIDKSIKYIDLSPLTFSRPFLIPSGLVIDYTYNYRYKDSYESTWTGFAIVSSELTSSKIIIKNDDLHKIGLDGNIINSGSKIINKVIVEDLDNIDNKSVTYGINDTYDIILNTNQSVANRHFKITIFCLSDDTTGFCAKGSNNEPWIPYTSNNRGSIIVSPGIKIVSDIKPIPIVDMSKLIYDTSYSNINRAGLITEGINKYLVVKEPSKDIFPGYFFNAVARRYDKSSVGSIDNTDHWIRQAYVNGTLITYTTGSNNNTVVDLADDIDFTWNNGNVLPLYPNTDPSGIYVHHSTYGYKIHIDNNSVSYDKYGFLFFDTAENIPTYYSISYAKVGSTVDTTKRFLYKLELESDNSGSLKPIVRSINFKFNKE